MNYLDNIKELIEGDIVLKKKHKLIENNSTLNTYFEIGKLIVEAQGGEERAKYGNRLIKEWSIELTKLYGKGYDDSNLRRMRQFYLTFKICGAVPHKLTWTNLSMILPIKEESKRNYYINLCIMQDLSSRKLKEKIKNQEYERLEYKNNIEIITDDSDITIKDMIKNPILIKTDRKIDKLSERALKQFILEKIDKLSERALKQFILEKIEEFLLELGYGFTYVGSEYRLGKFKCDLLFFNYELNCFVVIELKIRKLMPSDIGQIKYYMNYIDSNVKKNYMNESIGIILCKEDNQIVVKYVTDEMVLFSTYELI